MLEWFWSDPPETPLNLFFLGCEEGRRNFLHELYARGYSALFEGVAHVWDSLEEPRAYRCTLMGAASGAGGSGKAALMKTLRQFIDEALAADIPLPSRADYGSMDDWHQAASASFVGSDADINLLVERYSAVLNGQRPVAGQPS